MILHGGGTATLIHEKFCRSFNKPSLMSHYLTLPPLLDELELKATLGQRSEALSEAEFEILSQLLRYPEEPLSRDALKRAAGFDEESVPDRKLDAWVNLLIRKLNVLWPLFPVVRFVAPDHYMYSEKAPKRKSRS